MDAHATAPIAAAPQRSPVWLGIAGDERLARLVGSGSERAFAVLYERYHQPLYRYCRALLRDETDAHDALQAAFTAALSALQRGRRDAPLKPWLYRIAHNEAISLLRRRRAHEQLDEEAPASGISVHEEAERRERLSQLVEDLQQLPVRQRAALIMRELNGLSHQEIALALGTSAGATRQTIFEARRSLLEFAEGRAMSCDEVCRAISDGDGRSLRSRRVRAHLRECRECTAFADAIPARRTDLNALAAPLAPLAAKSLISGLLAHSSPHGGTATAAGGVGAGAAGKSALLGLGAKGAVGLAVIAGATVGLTRALPAGRHSALRAIHSRVASPAHASPGPGHSASSTLRGAGPARNRSAARSRRLRAAAPAGGSAVLATPLTSTAAAGHKDHVAPSEQHAPAGHRRLPAAHRHRPAPARRGAPGPQRRPHPGKRAAPKPVPPGSPTGGTPAPKANQAAPQAGKSGHAPTGAGAPAGRTSADGTTTSP